jgi:hypothetical protein
MSSGMIKAAREVLKQAWHEDDGFRNSYVANIACIIYDNSNIDMMKANDIADRILKQCFEKD